MRIPELEESSVKGTSIIYGHWPHGILLLGKLCDSLHLPNLIIQQISYLIFPLCYEGGSLKFFQAGKESFTSEVNLNGINEDNSGSGGLLMREQDVLLKLISSLPPV